MELKDLHAKLSNIKNFTPFPSPRVTQQSFNVNALTSALENISDDEKRVEYEFYQSSLLFEASFEVCRKVGGIYTVLRSKAHQVVELWQDRYVCLGTFTPNVFQLEAERLDPPTLIRLTLESISHKFGIEGHFGRWLIGGNPRVVLFNIDALRITKPNILASLKGELYNKSGLESPANEIDADYDASVLFGYAIYHFLTELRVQQKILAQQNPDNFQVYDVVAQFHEWMSGVAIPLLRDDDLDIGMIFTTHATVLGRFMSSGAVSLYEELDKNVIDFDAEARKRGIPHRHGLEKVAAHRSHVFSTVSEITAWEAEVILKRRPEHVLPNGLNVTRFEALHEFQNMHKASKDQIQEFVRGHFYSYLDFDFENTLYFFSAGRYEYLNKGVDMYLDSLNILNQKLKASGSKTTVVAFLIFPGQTNNYNVETLRGQTMMREVKRSVSQLFDSIEKRAFDLASRGTIPDFNNLMTRNEEIWLKRRLVPLHRDSLPPIVTHNMVNGEQDQILSHLRRVGLFNNRDDRVKVVFHPEFLSSNSPVLGLDYDDFVRGCHLGVFPSLYESWGYTPAECTIKGIPSVTSNLAGFANYMEKQMERQELNDHGIFVVDRRYQSADSAIQQLANYMHELCLKNRRERIEMRNKTESLSWCLDWRHLIQYYSKAWLAANHADKSDHPR